MEMAAQSYWPWDEVDEPASNQSIRSIEAQKALCQSSEVLVEIGTSVIHVSQRERTRREAEQRAKNLQYKPDGMGVKNRAFRRQSQSKTSARRPFHQSSWTISRRAWKWIQETDLVPDFWSAWIFRSGFLFFGFVDVQTPSATFSVRSRYGYSK